MDSVLRSIRRGKNSKRLGEAQLVSREECQGLDLDAKVELIRGLVPLGLMHVHELLEDELKALAGDWCARKHGGTAGLFAIVWQRN